MHEPSYSELQSQFEGMGITTMLRKKGLPAGWYAHRFYECKCRHDRDAVVMCERTTEDGDHGTRYVVWWVNMQMGGCFNGHYTDDEFEAIALFNSRKKRLV